MLQMIPFSWEASTSLFWGQGCKKHYMNTEQPIRGEKKTATRNQYFTILFKDIKTTVFTMSGPNISLALDFNNSTPPPLTLDCNQCRIIEIHHQTINIKFLKASTALR